MDPQLASESCDVELKRLSDACTDQRIRERESLWIVVSNAPISICIRTAVFVIFWLLFALVFSKIATPFLAITMVLWTPRWLIRARSLASLHATIAMHVDSRPPILYLRSFSSDNQLGIQGRGCLDRLVGGGIRELFIPFTAEEMLLRGLANGGPLVAIGSLDAGAGASRLPTTSDEWQAEVDQLLQKAQLVIVSFGNSKGLEWELFRIANSVPSNKVVLHVPQQRILDSKLATAFPKLVSGFNPWLFNFYSFDDSGNVMGARNLRDIPIVASLYRTPRIDFVFNHTWIGIAAAIPLLWFSILVGDLTYFANVSYGINCFVGIVWLIWRLYLSRVVGSRATELKRSSLVWFVAAAISAPILAILVLEAMGINWRRACGQAGNLPLRRKKRVYATGLMSLDIKMTDVDELSCKELVIEEPNSNLFDIPCGCGKELSVTDKDAGTWIVCECGNRISVPSLRALRSSHRQD